MVITSTSTLSTLSSSLMSSHWTLLVLETWIMIWTSQTLHCSHQQANIKISFVQKMCWSVKLEQSFVMHLSHNVESVLEYKPSISLIIIISLPSHHNFWILISSMTYPCLPFLSTLDCTNCGVTGFYIFKMLLLLWHCIYMTMIVGRINT